MGVWFFVREWVLVWKSSKDDEVEFNYRFIKGNVSYEIIGKGVSEFNVNFVVFFVVRWGFFILISLGID